MNTVEKVATYIGMAEPYVGMAETYVGMAETYWYFGLRLQMACLLMCRLRPIGLAGGVILHSIIC